jgi:hypothetical protein
MKTIAAFTVLLLIFCMQSMYCYGNIYIIIYATKNGKTGHAGVAFDNYRVLVSETRQDTLQTGTVTYFDLWPSNDEFGFFDYSKNQKAQFYKLPNAIWSQSLTIERLASQGIPHREHYAPDGIFMIQTSAAMDFKIMRELDKIMEEQEFFNPRYYNCSDFVNDALKQVLGSKLRIKEFIPFTFTATPNKLCRKVLSVENIVILQKPGQIINRSFFRERVLKRDRAPNPFRTTSVAMN